MPACDLRQPFFDRCNAVWPEQSRRAGCMAAIHLHGKGSLLRCWSLLAGAAPLAAGRRLRQQRRGCGSAISGSDGRRGCSPSATPRGRCTPPLLLRRPSKGVAYACLCGWGFVAVSVSRSWALLLADPCRPHGAASAA